MSNLLVDIKNNIIMNKFRFTYYILKFKTRFRKWLWDNVRKKTIHTIFSLHVKNYSKRK